MPRKELTRKELKLTEENPMTVLNIRQTQYLEARLQGLTPQAAAKAAGVNKASDYERNPKIRAAMKWAVRESFDCVEEIGKNEVLQGMKDAVEAAATSTELIQAWREIGKLIGAYEPERKILEVHDYSKEELKTLSEADLLRLAGDRMADAIDGEFYEVDEVEQEEA